MEKAWKIVAGRHPSIARWVNRAEQSDISDADFEAAEKAGLLTKLAEEGLYDPERGILGDGWLITTDADASDLNLDDAVVAYCAAP